MPYIETQPYLPPKQPLKTKEGFTSDGIFFELERKIIKQKLRSIDYWRKVYKRGYQQRRFTEEHALRTYQGIHASYAYEVQTDSSIEVDMDFIKSELNGVNRENTTAYTLYRLAVMCFRRPKPGFEETGKLWGRALFQAAHGTYPDPVYARGRIDEDREFARRRKVERKKAERLAKKKGRKIREPELFSPYSLPLQTEFTLPYYENRLEEWTRILKETTVGQKIDYKIFQDEHGKNVRVATMTRDNRDYNKTRFQPYEPSFFYDLLKSEILTASEAYYWGLVALRAPSIEGKERDTEIVGFKLLRKAFELSQIPFYAWVNRHEYFVKKSKIQPPRHTKIGMFAKDLAWQRGDPGDIGRIDKPLYLEPEGDDLEYNKIPQH